MFRAPADWHDKSMKLASVLEDIGVNERMVLKRRRALLVKETTNTIAAQSTGYNNFCYFFGSQSEGTTTIGLNSDIDFLGCTNNANVIQSWQEWKTGVNNFMMIQDENTTQGYCFLQKLYSNVPLPVTVNEAEYEENAIYKIDKVIMKNTSLNNSIPELTREGAAFTSSNIIGHSDIDRVVAFPCKSFPRSVSAWLYQQTQTGNISNHMKRYIESNPCLVVMTGCKGSPYEEYEWRISTSFIERCLMFSLNITQLQCYVMMKMTLNTYFKSSRSKLLSSFVCKNILLLCIQCMPFDAWQPRNLLHVFIICLLKLKQCVLCGECPHFIIHGNNLLRRKLTTESKKLLVGRIDRVIELNGCAFLDVKIDDFGNRLKSKFNSFHGISSITDSPEIVLIRITSGLLLSYSISVSELHRDVLDAVKTGKSDMCNILITLTEMYFRGSYLEQYALRLFTPRLCSTFGGIKASNDIHNGNCISPETLTWLDVGLDSDVASGRLKLASVFYCVGDMNRTETILRQTEDLYHLDIVTELCGCYVKPVGYIVSEQFAQYAVNLNEDATRHIIAFCVQFLPSEIQCIPHELRYEMFRSTPEDMPHRRKLDFWMDWAVIDSLPYLYFLQYKTYSCLQRNNDKYRALSNLANSIFTTRNLGHKETALNLLGQCMELETRYQDALNFYSMSLSVRSRNNVAKIHVCRLLSSLIRS